MNHPLQEHMMSNLRGHDIGDAMDRLVERAVGDLASPTVAGAPAGLSRDASQAKPLIDYRKETK